MQMIHCPYRVCPLGAHIDHQFGIVTGFALDHGVTLEYEPTEDGTVFVTSRNYPKTVECSLFDLPERKMYWGDFLVGAIHTLSRKYPLSVGIRGEIAGSLPTGGLSSSAAVIITYLSALCRVNGIPLTEPELIKLAIWEEQNFIGVHVGKLDQSCEVYSKKEHLLYLDTLDDSCELIPVPPNMPKFEIAVIFSGLERSLAGSAYNMRVDECRAAAYALKAFSHMEYGKYHLHEKIKKQQKIKVAFLVISAAEWAAEQVYQRLSQDEHLECYVVVCPLLDREKESRMKIEEQS